MLQSISATKPDSARSLTRSQWRVIALASLGGPFEYYDFIIYSIFARYIAHHFFPTNDPLVSLILSCSVLALGFLSHPLGGIVLSGLGDRFGRRAALLASLLRLPRRGRGYVENWDWLS